MPKREFCLQEAASAERLANQTTDPRTRNRLLRAVEQWKELAESFEETDRREPFRPQEIAAIKAAISDFDQRAD